MRADPLLSNGGADNLLSGAGLSALRQKAASSPQDANTVRQVARQFEALLTQQVLKSARAASLSDEPVSGAGLDLYKDLFDQQMAQQMSAGKGLGLADVLVRQLKLPDNPTSTSSVGGSATTNSLLPLASNPAPIASAEAGATPAVMATSAAGKDSSHRSFIDRIWSVAEAAAKKLGIATEAIVGHAALETGWGKHLPSGDSFNLFGLKSGSHWQGDSVTSATTEVLNGKSEREVARFRRYQSLEQGMAGYVDFLGSNPRYAKALAAGSTSVEGFAKGLQQAGYATDPHYAAKLTAAIARVRHARSSAV